MKRFLVVPFAVLVLAGVAAHGAQAKGGGNHGSAVSKVARSHCVAVNPHNPKVKNHGMCVSHAAHGNHGKGHGHRKGHGPKAEGTDTP